ncbi:MAG: hypothetical protein ACJ76S_01140 [Solirubrobacteraceae bacterium]
MTEVDRRFRFAQFEFPWSLGPEDGRYVLRTPGTQEPSHVLVLATLGAPQRRLLRRRRPRRAQAEPDAQPVSTTRVTVIDAEPVPPAAAEAWLEGMSREASAAALDEALRAVNRALRAHRLTAADASIHDVSRDQALVARLGHGRGEQVADGRWSQAVEVPLDVRRRQRRIAALRPQERLAALLGGRDQPLACEELALRARVDLKAGRSREAALQLRVALEAAITELRPQDAADMSQRLDELRGRRAAVGPAANEALTGELSPATVAAVEEALGRLEAALRARAAAGAPSNPRVEG